jgi:hypothetical protein
VHIPAELSIDCGLPDSYSPYTDPDTGIYYVSDAKYDDAGENHAVAAAGDPTGRRAPAPSLAVAEELPIREVELLRAPHRSPGHVPVAGTVRLR